MVGGRGNDSGSLGLKGGRRVGGEMGSRSVVVIQKGLPEGPPGDI